MCFSARKSHQDWLYTFLVMAQEKRETRFCQAHQTIGIAKHPLRNELKKQIPHARFYHKQVFHAPR